MLPCQESEEDASDLQSKRLESDMFPREREPNEYFETDGMHEVREWEEDEKSIHDLHSCRTVKVDLSAAKHLVKSRKPIKTEPSSILYSD